MFECVAASSRQIVLPQFVAITKPIYTFRATLPYWDYLAVRLSLPCQLTPISQNPLSLPIQADESKLPQGARALLKSLQSEIVCWFSISNLPPRDKIPADPPPWLDELVKAVESATVKYHDVSNATELAAWHLPLVSSEQLELVREVADKEKVLPWLLGAALSALRLRDGADVQVERAVDVVRKDLWRELVPYAVHVVAPSLGPDQGPLPGWMSVLQLLQGAEVK